MPVRRKQTGASASESLVDGFTTRKTPSDYANRANDDENFDGIPFSNPSMSASFWFVLTSLRLVNNN